MSRMYPRIILALLALTFSGVVLVVSDKPAEASIDCPAPIAYIKNDDNGLGLYAQTNCANTLQRLAGSTPLSPSWDVKRNTVSYTGASSPGSEPDTVYTVPLNGKPPKVEMKPSVRIGASILSPDGTRYAQERIDPDGITRIYIVKRDGTNPVWLTNRSNLLEAQPAWSLDGSRIAIIAFDPVVSTPPQIWVVSVASHQSYQITFEAGWKRGPAWTPDGQYILYSATGNIHTDIYSRPAVGGNPVRLTNLPGDSLEVTVSNDWVMGFIYADSGPRKLILQHLGTGAVRAIANGYDLDLPAFARTGAVTPRPAAFPLGSSTPPATITNPPVLRACPKLQFVGVRGSGETNNSAGGYGDTVAAIKDRIKVSGMRSDFIDYPSINVEPWRAPYPAEYMNSVAAGETAFASFVSNFILACPQTYIIAAGYSQGAEVIGNVIQNWATDSTKAKHIAAVILIGDPLFNPNQLSVDAGDYDPNLAGIGQLMGNQLRSIPAGFTPHLRSYCTKGDPVCNYSPGNAVRCAPGVPGCPHLAYVSLRWTDKAASWAVQTWKKQPALV